MLPNLLKAILNVERVRTASALKTLNILITPSVEGPVTLMAVSGRQKKVYMLKCKKIYIGQTSQTLKRTNP